MKRNILISALVLFAFTALASGQPIRGSYFFETSLMRGKLNASFAPQNNYVSIPVIGYLGADVYSNAGLANFLFAQGDKKNVTFLHPSVSTDAFLSGLPEKDPFVTERLETDVLGAGIRIGANGFITAALSVVQNADVQIPKELLRFAKAGGNASIRDLGARLGGYAQLAVGYSHDMGDMVEGLHLGGRVKLLAGLAALDANLSRADVVMDGQQLSVSTNGTGYIAGFSYVDGSFKADKIGLNGFGFAVDLGVEYRIPLEGFINGVNISASVNDLGFLGFSKNVKMLTSMGSASFSGFKGIDADYDFSTNFQNVVDDFTNLANFNTSNAEGYHYKLSPSIFAGVEAPFLNEMMSLGVLYYYAQGYHNIMASYNLTPVRWFNFGLNYTFVGPARTYGFYAEFIPKMPVGFFIGMEKASLKTNSKGLGIKNLTETVCLGLNVAFGGK